MNTSQDINTIKELLSLYYEGKTSISQEEALIEFFSGKQDIPIEMVNDRELFNAMSHLSDDIDIPADLERRLNKHIDNLEFTDRNRKKSWIKRYSAMIAAASIVIAVVIGTYLIYNPIEPINNNVVSNNQLIAANTPRHDEVTDINVAYEKTEMALMMLSSKLNKSGQGIAVADEKINQINDKLNSILK